MSTAPSSSSIGNVGVGGPSSNPNNTNNSSAQFSSSDQGQGSSNCNGDGDGVGAGPADVIVNPLNLDFLPAIYDIIKCVERESTESAQNKRSEYIETSQKVVELQRRFEDSRNQIRKLPGIDLNKGDQIKKFEGLKRQLLLKKKLIQKYKDMCALEGVQQYLNPQNSNSSRH